LAKLFSPFQSSGHLSQSQYWNILPLQPQQAPILFRKMGPARAPVRAEEHLSPVFVETAAASSLDGVQAVSQTCGLAPML